MCMQTCAIHTDMYVVQETVCMYVYVNMWYTYIHVVYVGNRNVCTGYILTSMLYVVGDSLYVCMYIYKHVVYGWRQCDSGYVAP